MPRWRRGVPPGQGGQMRGIARVALCAAGCALAAVAQADPQLAARAIVERYVVATGGRAALEADTLLHVRGRLSDAAMSGTFELWRRASDHVLRTQHLGLLRTREGYDGARGWDTDYTSRKVSPLEGKDLEALRAEAWFGAEQWARDTTTRLTLGSTSFSSGHTLQAVEVTPPVGPRQTLWFDDKAGLLARVTHRRDQYDWSEALSAWKSLAGRKRATMSAVGMPEFPSSYHRAEIDSAWAEAPRDPAAFSPPASTAAPVAWLGARGRIEMPFHYRRGAVWVSLSVNGAAPAEVILDPGAFNTRLDRGYAQTPGPQAEGEHVAEGLGGYDPFGFTTLHSLRWGAGAARAVELHDLRAGVIELQDGLSSVEWGRARGGGRRRLRHVRLHDAPFTALGCGGRASGRAPRPARRGHRAPGRVELGRVGAHRGAPRLRRAEPVHARDRLRPPGANALRPGDVQAHRARHADPDDAARQRAERGHDVERPLQGPLHRRRRERERAVGGDGAGHEVRTPDHEAQGGAALGRRHRRCVRGERVPSRLAGARAVPVHPAGGRAHDASPGRRRQPRDPGQHRYDRARAVPLHVRLRPRHALAPARRALRRARGVHAERHLVHALGGRGGGVRRGAALARRG